MTTPPPDRPDPVEPDPTRWAAPEEPDAAEPVSLAKSDEPQRAVAEPAPEFDPYRFGAPEHPVPPEYAPPGYRPPPHVGRTGVRCTGVSRSSPDWATGPTA
jgi:hypothetical protein